MIEENRLTNLRRHQTIGDDGLITFNSRCHISNLARVGEEPLPGHIRSRWNEFQGHLPGEWRVGIEPQ